MFMCFFFALDYQEDPNSRCPIALSFLRVFRGESQQFTYGVVREGVKNLLMPLFLRKGCFPVDFQEVKRALRTKSGKRPIKAGKRPINEGKRPIKGMVLVGVSVSCLMGCFRAPPPKTAPLKRPIKRSVYEKGSPDPTLPFVEKSKGNPKKKTRV